MVQIKCCLIDPITYLFMIFWTQQNSHLLTYSDIKVQKGEQAVRDTNRQQCLQTQTYPSCSQFTNEK